MNKPFKSIDDQYNLLLSRGLKFSDENIAKTYLLRNNYYNILNSYGKYFVDKDDVYKAGTNFDEITRVYYFDKEIKNIFFKAILEAEKHLKSLIAYYFSEAHKDQSYPYLIATNFKHTDILNIAPLISCLSNIISKYQKKEYQNAIKHYITNYHNVPLWILINYMSLGQTVTFYKRMNLSEQNKVAKEFSKMMAENIDTDSAKLQSQQLSIILENILEIRNIVAHNNRLLEYRCRRNIPYLPIHRSLSDISENQPRQNVYHVFLAMQCLLTKNQYAIMHNTIRSRANNLNQNLTTISCNEILGSLGFPIDWYKTNKIKQN